MPFTWVNLKNGFVSDVAPINAMGQIVASHDAQLVGVERSQTITLANTFTSTTSNVQQVVTGFSLPVAANATYVFNCLLLYTAPAANDIGFGLQSPSGTSMISHVLGMALTASGGGPDDGPGRWAASTSSSGLITNLGGADSTVMGARWDGKFTTGSIAGNWVLTASPLTSGATTTVRAGSYMHAVRVS